MQRFIETRGGKVSVGSKFYTRDGAVITERVLEAVGWQGFDYKPDVFAVCQQTGRLYPASACYYTAEQARIENYQYAKYWLARTAEEEVQFRQAVNEYERGMVEPPAPETDADVMAVLVQEGVEAE